MPLWLGGGVTIRQNTTEADKVIRSGRKLESPATHRQTHQLASLPTTALHIGKEGDSVVSVGVRQQTTISTPPAALTTPTLTNDDTANLRADHSTGANLTTQADPRTSIPAVFSDQLLYIQSAVASLTSMVREQALEIGELRKTIDRSAGIITITNATSDETLSALTSSITANHESLATIQRTLTDDVMSRRDKFHDMSSLFTTLHSTTDTKISDAMVRVIGLTDDFKSLATSYSTLSGKQTHAREACGADGSVTADTTLTPSSGTTASTPVEPMARPPPASSTHVEHRSRGGTSSPSARLQTLISKYTTSPVIGDDDTTLSLQARVASPTTGSTHPIHPTATTTRVTATETAPRDQDITFCLACYGDDDLGTCGDCGEFYHDRCMVGVTSQPGLFCQECAGLAIRRSANHSSPDSVDSSSSAPSNSTSSSSPSSSSPDSKSSESDTEQDDTTNKPTHPHNGPTPPLHFDTPTDASSDMTQAQNSLSDIPRAPLLSPPWRKSPTSRYAFRSGTKK